MIYLYESSVGLHMMNIQESCGIFQKNMFGHKV